MSHERTIHKSLDDIVEADLNKNAQKHTEYVNLLMGVEGADKATLSAMSTDKLIALADKFTGSDEHTTARDLGIAGEPSVQKTAFPTDKEILPAFADQAPIVLPVDQEALSLETASDTSQTFLARLHAGFNKAKAAAFQKAGEINSGVGADNFKARMLSRAEAYDNSGNSLKAKTAVVLGKVGLATAVVLFAKTSRLGEEGVAEAAGLFNSESPLGVAPVIDMNGEDTELTDQPIEADYLRSESHEDDRMVTEGAFDSDSKERSNKEADRHVLEKIKNNPSLAAAVLEVRESGHMDKNFSLEDVNQDTKAFSVSGENGEYSDKGQKAMETLEKSWKGGEIGSLLSDKEVREMQQKYDFINHGTDEGEYKNAIDDTTYRAGIFDYRPDLGDKIYEKELGNGRTAYFKVNEEDPSRDCLNVQTLSEKSTPNLVEVTATPQQSQGGSEPQPEDGFTSNPNTTPEDAIEVDNSVGRLPQEDKPVEDTPAETPQEETPPPTTTNTPKGEVLVDSQGPASTGGVTATGPGQPEAQQPAGGQTATEAEQQAGGSPAGSQEVAPGAEQVPKPEAPATGAQGETSSGIVSE